MASGHFRLKITSLIIVIFFVMIGIYSGFVSNNVSGVNREIQHPNNKITHQGYMNTSLKESHSYLASNENYLGIPSISSVSVPLINKEFSHESYENGNIPWYSIYKEPSPMGIGFIGLSPTNKVFSYSTTSFLGIVKVFNLTTYNQSLNSSIMTFQLNVVLNFRTGLSSYSYWIQDIAFVNTKTNFVSFSDEIWNFTISGNVLPNMLNSTVSGNGDVFSYQDSSYYAYGPGNLPGNYESFSIPYYMKLMVNTTTNYEGYPIVSFYYNDGYGWIEYDNVTFIFANNLQDTPKFLVLGVGTLYDAALILGGSGGGSQTNDERSDVFLQLEYWNGHNYQMPPFAYNFGPDTKEGISNVSTDLTFSESNGTLSEKLFNYPGEPGVLYNTSEVATLRVNSPLASGTLYVNNSAYAFINGVVNITMAPGNYQVFLYNNQGQLVWSKYVYLYLGQYLNLSTTVPTCYVDFEETRLPIGTTWYVNISNEGSYKSTNSTIILSLQNGNYSYTVSSGDKEYAPTHPAGSFKVNSANVNIVVSFYLVVYSVTLTESGLPSGTSWSVSLNGTTRSSSNDTITFSVPNGTYSYTIGSVSRYTASPSSGSILVNGANVNQAIAFTTTKTNTYTITFTESGLQSGTSWLVILNGKTETSTTNTISFTEPNGTYSFSIASINGYSVSPSSGSITVKGTNISQNITFKSVTTTTSHSSNDYLIYIIIAVVVIAAAIGAVVAMGRRKK